MYSTIHPHSSNFQKIPVYKKQMIVVPVLLQIILSFSNLALLKNWYYGIEMVFLYIYTAR